jgi:hypothetical protein
MLSFPELLSRIGICGCKVIRKAVILVVCQRSLITSATSHRRLKLGRWTVVEASPPATPKSLICKSTFVFLQCKCKLRRRRVIETFCSGQTTGARPHQRRQGDQGPPPRELLRLKLGAQTDWHMYSMVQSISMHALSTDICMLCHHPCQPYPASAKTNRQDTKLVCLRLLC